MPVSVGILEALGIPLDLVMLEHVPYISNLN